MIILFTGLSGAGKSTLCQAAQREFRRLGYPVEVLDGDEVRQHLCKDLGFSKQDRIENLMRIHYVAQLLSRNGIVVLVAAISPYREAREELRRRTSSAFLEVYVNAPLEVCEWRDPKGLYRKARQGMISAFTGLSDPYEPPLNPDVVCYTDVEAVDESCEKVVARVNDLVRRSSNRRENDGTSAILLSNSLSAAK